MQTSTTGFVVGGTEALFRVQPVTLSPDDATMSVGSGLWLTDPDAGVLRGSLGVALDDVTGSVVAAGAPPGRWPVSLGIRLDFVADPPVDGTPMRATGALVSRTATGGVTRGAVIGADDAVIALVTQRSHLVEVEAVPVSATPQIDTAANHVQLREVLGLAPFAHGEWVLPPNPFAANSMGNVHGGVLICASEAAAMSAVGAAGELRTSSIDIIYVRPCDADAVTTFRTEVVHQGRSLVVVRVIADNVEGRPCSIATVTAQR
ncbi:thioesterase family protein [Gordonia sp. zg691]|uniref:PaaI family thioesterase n=1 Tax=Gordonia jinghuaiqii TaxID=2758710 RepID=UPI0016624FA7|nr:hotdog domain-containing protein [Gordonia jinghuaiqii]MBD0860321.1 thioesterase family protein [Gordonia jinghuaiqii]